ncbi:MAG: anaerobic ribonucleoside-triphosphate reductase activating protein [Alphaproteobacteria bacterium]
MVLPVCNITPFTMQDYPDHMACIIWLGGCNFRCDYCHNPEFVHFKKENSIPFDDVIEFLESRTELLDAVVLSGGESTLTRDVEPFITRLKEMGFLVKIDTNGSNPKLIKKLLKNKMIDYVALDYKATRAKLERVTGYKDFDTFYETLELLVAQKDVPLEIRTTVHTSLLQEEDITEIMQDLDALGYTGTYYVQNFQNHDDVKTLKPMPKQFRKLDFTKLPAPENFTLDKRNF